MGTTRLDSIEQHILCLLPWGQDHQKEILALVVVTSNDSPPSLSAVGEMRLLRSFSLAGAFLRLCLSAILARATTDFRAQLRRLLAFLGQHSHKRK